MNTNSLKIMLTVLLLISFFSCSSDDSENPSPGNDSENPSLSDEKKITSFSINEVSGTINETNKSITVELSETNLTSLTPSIIMSKKAKIDPASGTPQDFSNPFEYTVTAENGTNQKYTVTVSSSLISKFSFNDKNYEIIKEKKTWKNASSFASDRGGYLTEINDLDEQNAIFNALNKASITNSNTVAPDGGGAAYVWIGGNDLTTEGNWVWDGNNDGKGIQFWLGDTSGNSVNNLYNNWGKEPDNYLNSQDALGLALTNWPLGSAGQWNDIDDSNKLYFVIEFD